MSTICPLPWVHLATHPEGKVTLCCVSSHVNNMSAARTDSRVLNLNYNSVDEVINSDYFKQVRLEMLAGKEPAACARCYQEERDSGQSKRLLESSKFPFIPITQDNGNITPNFRFIELRLGNLCNIRCRTCNPASSTQWITEYNKLQKELSFVTEYNHKINTTWTESDEFWDQLLDASQNLELIYINGGEPTLVKKHWQYLERLIERGLHKQVTLWYNINMTHLPDELLTIWRQFKKVIVHASIDDLSQRNSYIRRGTDWKIVEENLHKLQKNNWIDLEVTQTVSWLNVYYVDEFLDYFNCLNIKTHINVVYDPIFLSPKVLPDCLKTIVFEKLKSIPQLEKFLSIIKTGSNDIDFLNGIKYNKWLDINRDESFSSVFPEWHEIIKKHYEI